MVKTVQSLPRFRTRLIPLDLGTTYNISNGQPLSRWYSKNRSTEALLVSQNHRIVNGRWSGGGSFMTWHRHATVSPSQVITVRGVSSPFKGLLGQKIQIIPLSAPQLTSPPKTEATYVPPSIASELAITAAYGPEMWDKAKPGKSQAQVLNALKELVSEGIPSLPGQLLRRVLSARNAGKEYLNVQFGWVPLIKDIQKMYETYRNIEKLLWQLRRDNGQLIRRRRQKEVQKTTTSSETSDTGQGSWPFVNGLTSTTVRHRITTVTHVHERVWFSGAFQYWIPDAGSSAWTRRATRALFGLNPNPEVIWNALPWSWLADWFSNVGHNLSNMSENAAENCVAKYAYVMREKRTTTITTVHVDLSGISSWDIDVRQPVCSYMEETILKTRVAATPYGFNIGLDGLTPYQSSILAALGLSRSRF